MERKGGLALNRTEKTGEIDRLRDTLQGVPAVLLTDFRGMTVEESSALRRALRAENVQYEVVKNTLVRKAVVGTRLEGLAPHFKGNTAIAFHPEDPVAPARVITKFMKENPKLVLKAGWLDGRVLDASGVQALATLPGKQELRSRLLSVVIGVPTAFVRVLTAGPSAFVRVLEARRQQLGE